MGPDPGVFMPSCSMRVVSPLCIEGKQAIQGLRGGQRDFSAAQFVSLLVGGILLAFAVAVASAQDRTSWQDYGGSVDNSHYLDLKQITKNNVDQLKVAWFYETHDGLPY